MKKPADLSITYSLFVNESHIDELEHVNNVVYVGWIQDAAVMHWWLSPLLIGQSYRMVFKSIKK